MVYKCRSSTYRCGQRSASWIKRKARHELDVLIRPLLTRKGIVERVSCDLPVDERLIRVGYAEVLEAKVRERLAAHPEELASASVAFSSVSARGERREARLVSPEPVPRA